jgi:1-aminocyclopropane-1-carboxylate deaminase/D-cysteine desulfhydrase-like pyridoxal-dependent ACC family enzyme
VQIEGLDLPGLKSNQLKLDVLRLDKIHPVVSGNKYFKLKYYLDKARAEGYKRILTFGGAYSNHLVAAAFTANLLGFESIGIVRGEKPVHLSHTLHSAEAYGMELIFVSRAEYLQKADEDYVEKLSRKFANTLLIPEGGAGPDGIKGAEEIVFTADTSMYSHFLCAIGTGTMALGLARAARPGQQILGISVLKSSEKEQGTISAQLAELEKRSQVAINRNYHFGGYAKKDKELIRFMNSFYKMTSIPLDFVYTAKLFYGALDLINQKYFREQSNILLVHSGGLQGNLSMSKGELLY